MLRRSLLFGALLFTVYAMAAAPEDFELRILPAQNDLHFLGPSGTATVDLSVVLTSSADGVRGWSFGVILDLITIVNTQATITSVAFPNDYLTVNGGVPPDYATTSYYAYYDLENKIDDCTEPGPCTGLHAGALTQDVIIDLQEQNVVPATAGLELLDFTVWVAAWAESNDDESAVALAFTDAAGSPSLSVTVRYGPDDVAPIVQEGAIITLSPAPAIPPASFTIDVADGGLVATESAADSMVTLNFDKDGMNTGAEIQGWSYGVCVEDPAKLRPVDAVIDGTDTASVKNGAPPDFNSINLYPDGVTHGVVIDLASQITVSAQNDWSDVIVTYENLMTESDGGTYVMACHRALGYPPVSNVMVIGGNSVLGSMLEDPDGEREDNSDAYNTAGFFHTPIRPDWFVPGSANFDGQLDIADGVYILNFLFRGGPEPPCMAAADANGDGVIDSSDAVLVILYVFLDGVPPARGLGCQPYFGDTDLTCEAGAEPGC